MTACGPLCAPIAGGADPCGLRAVLGRCSRRCRGQQLRASGEAQRNGFAGERRSSGMSEFSPLWGGNEGYGACDDEEEQEKALALLLRLGGHFRPQCGRFRELELALF